MSLSNIELYDNYVSLGGNCEVAFQLRRVLGHDRSSFFGWNITPTHALLKLLREDFAGILTAENMRHSHADMFEDVAYNYAFHADFSIPDLYADGLFVSKWTKLIEKSDYFLTRFRNLSNTGRSAFFYCTEDTEDVHRNMAEVRTLLTQYVPIHLFDLIVAQPKINLEQPFDDGNLHFRQLTRVAPGWDAHDGHVSSWDKIFAEFPYREGLRLSGY